MNPLTERNRTFAELAAELRARLGFVSQGSSASANDAIIRSFLQEAHDYVSTELDPAPLRTLSTITAVAGSRLFDWHDDTADQDIDPGGVISVWVKISETDRQRLRQGITEDERSYSDLRQAPERYDTLGGQLEIWPTPERDYDLVIEHTASVGRFEQPTDRPGVPDRLLFLYALAQAKSHYRHPDAQASAATFQNLLSKTKMRQKENRRYFMASGGGHSSQQVVRGSDGSYRLRS